MPMVSKRHSLYDFTIDIFLIKQVIEEKDKSLSKIYNNALTEIYSLLDGKTTFYDLESRTFDLVTLSAENYSNQFKDHKAGLVNLLKIMEENDRNPKLF